MDMPTIDPPTSRIRGLFVRVLKIDPASDETDLIETGVIDSLALVELLVALEQEFSVSLPLETLDIESFRSIRAIADLIAVVDGRVAH